MPVTAGWLFGNCPLAGDLPDPQHRDGVVLKETINFTSAYPQSGHVHVRR